MEMNEKPAPVLVLLPGLDGTGKLFTPFVAALTALNPRVVVQIVAYPTDVPLGYEELEARVRAVLPQDRSYVLLGESFSGPIAIRLAAAAPSHLLGMILVGTFAKNPYPALGWAAPLAFLVPLKSLPRWVRAPLMWGSNIRGSPGGPRVPRRAERAIAGVAGAVVRRRIQALLRVDAGEALRCIRLPALIVHATKDRVVPRAATRWMSARLSGAQVEAIIGPHLLLQAAPQECAAAVMTFLNRLQAPA
jgi:pimeloyl-[acyl-carrier protein] methyl ester esterase